MSQPIGPPVELPAGSIEYDGIVNLVDANAAAALEAHLTSSALEHPSRRSGLVVPVNFFLKYYPEEYDFIFFFTDHPLDTGTQGKFEAINQPAQPGTGRDFDVYPGGYQTTGRLLAAAGIQVDAAPMGHEVLHYWANHLASDLGLSELPNHWGFSSANGALGGFDESTLVCLSSSATNPRECAPGGDGRVRFRAASFSPQGNFPPPFSPLELYLMGLATPDEVPPDFLSILDGTLFPDTYDADNRTVEFDGAGMQVVSFSEIVARHGTATLRTSSERAFRSAFVILSSEPAKEERLVQIALTAALFGGRATHPSLGDAPQFETMTGGRATMDTQIGQRRAQGDEPPAPRELFLCDVLAQDCSDQKACYGGSTPVCALSDQVQENEPCASIRACAPGLDCMANKTSPDAYSCQRYCDSADDSSPEACATLCPDREVVFTVNDEPSFAICAPD